MAGRDQEGGGHPSEQWPESLKAQQQNSSEGQPNQPNQQPSSWDKTKPLPDDPTKLGPDWKKNPQHQDPNGEQHINDKTGEKLEWNKGRPGQPGNRGKTQIPLIANIREVYRTSGLGGQQGYTASVGPWSNCGTAATKSPRKVLKSSPWAHHFAALWYE